MKHIDDSVAGTPVQPDFAGHRAWLGRQMSAGLPTCVDRTPKSSAADDLPRSGGRPVGGPVRGGSAAPLGLSTVHNCSQESTEDEKGKWFEQVIRERRHKRLRRDVRDRAEEIERGNACLGTVEWYEGGTLVKLKSPRKYQGSTGGFRGDIKGFSRQSRARLLHKIAKLDRRTCGLPIFCTLTYPGEWPGDPARWKRDLKTWRDRLRRKHPEAWAVWKLEPQKRGAPHYHLLIFGIEHIPKEWIAQSWYEVVGSGDARHLRAGTRIESIRSWGGVMSYAAKYCGKVIEELPTEWRKGVGRWWGIHNQDAADAHQHRHVVKVHRKAWFKIRRAMLGLLRRKGRFYPVWNDQGMSDISGMFNMYKLVEWAFHLVALARPSPGAAIDFVGDGVAPF